MNLWLLNLLKGLEKLKQAQLERSHEESAVGNQVDKTGEMTEKPLPKEAGAEEKASNS